MRTPVRVIVLLIAIGAVVAVLFTVVFPWVERTLVDDPVLTSARTTSGHVG